MERKGKIIQTHTITLSVLFQYLKSSKNTQSNKAKESKNNKDIISNLHAKKTTV